jgi:salicylate hydroxylase
MAASKNFHIAIVGGGIAGLTLAIALHHRDIPATLYESAAHFGEIGAGVSFASNTVQAMEICHPGVLAAFDRVRTHNGWAAKRSVWFDYHDGTADARDPAAAFSIRTRIGQNAVHRAEYLDELVKLLPADKARFGKRLVDVTEGEDGRLVMSFLDGSTATADAVIGCDGIKSRVRQLIVGEDHPSAHPSYTYKYAYRGLVPMDKAVEAVGEEMARNSCMHVSNKSGLLEANIPEYYA